MSDAPFLILPPSVARSRERGKQVLKCFCCGSEFPLDEPEKFGRHVRNCSDAHDDEIQAEAARRRSSYFQRAADEELYDHIRRGGN
jgi:hypothetical protein